jgi:superfamily II DNA or RNA helicase
MKLRDYQEQAITAIDQKLAEHQSTLIEMATGCGKTVLFAHVADRWPGNVLVLAHREELVRQAQDKIWRVMGENPGVEMGMSKSRYKNKVVIATVQTMHRERRRERYDRDHFGLIIVDEAHHGVAPIYRKVFDHFRSAKKLFVTATPKRTDAIGLHNVCDSVAFSYGIERAIEDGWLVPIQQKIVKVDGLDFSKARTIANDFNQADLERILTEEEPLHGMCSSANQIIAGRQSLWFCASVAHARACVAVLSRYANAEEVAFVCGDTPSDERARIVADYKAGRIKHLCNCALYLEGFDAPNTAVVVMARPTKSLLLYMQILGRGTRVLEGVVEDLGTPEERKVAIAGSLKSHMLVIDFAGNAGKHKIIQATDVLAGNYAEGIKDYTRKTIIRENLQVDIADALERAQAEVNLLAQEQERRKFITAKPKFRTYDVDPFVRQYTPQAKVSGGSAMQRYWLKCIYVAIRKDRKAASAIGMFKEKFKLAPWEANVNPLANGQAGEWQLPAASVFRDRL